MVILTNFLGSIRNAVMLFLLQLPIRIWRLLRHIFFVPFSSRRRNQFNWTKLTLTSQYGLAFVWWILVIFLKVLDLSGIWEMLDILQGIFKFNSRKLNALELQEAQRVFGRSLPYSAIRIDESSLLATIGARINKTKQLGLVTFRHINFTRKLNCAPGNADMSWLIHELTHVSQMQQLGSQYIIEALYAQHSSGYSYGGQNSLTDEQKLHAFNLEQQAEIARHFYEYSLHGERDSTIYHSYIKQMRAGKF